jgi:hypothetical protein
MAEGTVLVKRTALPDEKDCSITGRLPQDSLGSVEEIHDFPHAANSQLLDRGVEINDQRSNEKTIHSGNSRMTKFFLSCARSSSDALMPMGIDAIWRAISSITFCSSISRLSNIPHFLCQSRGRVRQQE